MAVGDLAKGLYTNLMFPTFDISILLIDYYCDSFGFVTERSSCDVRIFAAKKGRQIVNVLRYSAILVRNMTILIIIKREWLDVFICSWHSQHFINQLLWAFEIP